MANWFETVTKTLADDKLSRRKAMRKAAGAAAGIALAAFIPGEAFAASPDICPNGNCHIGFPFCGGNSHCNCYEKRNNNKHGCGCNIFCSQAQSCHFNSNCPFGWFCAYNTGCNCFTGVGICIQKCTRTCTAVAGAGKTSASH